MPEHHQQRSSPTHCTCGKECKSCTAETLCVTSGCAMEAKQYEYNLHKKMEHSEHEAPATPDSKQHDTHDVSKMSHHDHEAAMSNPQMAKEMEADMRKRFFIALILSIPIILYSPVGINYFKLNLPTPLPVNWILFILTTPVVFWAGSIFITGTYYSLKAP